MCISQFAAIDSTLSRLNKASTNYDNLFNKCFKNICFWIIFVIIFLLGDAYCHQMMSFPKEQSYGECLYTSAIINILFHLNAWVAINFICIARQVNLNFLLLTLTIYIKSVQIDALTLP